MDVSGCALSAADEPQTQRRPAVGVSFTSRCAAFRLDKTSSPVLRTSYAAGISVRVVNREDAVARLPEPYAEALRLHEAGLDAAIPDCLGVATEAVGPLLVLAEAKLATVMSSTEVDGPPDAG